ncbi:MAG: hypothetical protein EU544_00630 [Promethearchaeota archaeon]|nr:MAG: hypothetical protein EU544_00630 [Candidatus Lokiarchaeota archaeon]
MMITVIAMGELRSFLQENLPHYEDPVVYISSDFIPGCPKCNSSATVYYVKLEERSSIPSDSNVANVKNHKFPIDIFVKYPVLKGPPQQIVIGTKETKGETQMILRRVAE